MDITDNEGRMDRRSEQKKCLSAFTEEPLSPDEEELACDVTDSQSGINYVGSTSCIYERKLEEFPSHLLNVTLTLNLDHNPTTIISPTCDNEESTIFRSSNVKSKLSDLKPEWDNLCAKWGMTVRRELIYLEPPMENFLDRSTHHVESVFADRGGNIIKTNEELETRYSPSSYGSFSCINN